MEVWIKMDKMKVYHGSTQVVTSPDLSHSRDKIDFGRGFYTTEDKFMAKKWASNKNNAIINEYELDTTELNIVKLGLSKNWLNFVASNCGYSEQKYDISNVDIIIGPTADDKLFATLEKYFDGDISAEQAIRYLNIANHSEQIVLISDKVISQLKFNKYEQLDTIEKKNVKDIVIKERKLASRALEKLIEKDREKNHVMKKVFVY